MGRYAKFDRRQITSAALALVADGGPRAATVAAIANRLGAPTGSIYHRYQSRELLLAELWMDVVEGFQAGFVAELDRPDVTQAALRAARYMPEWVRGHMTEARLLLLHRREDFTGEDWPEALMTRAEALKQQMGKALRAFCRRRYGRATGAAMQRARFALLDVPYGALRPYVQEAEPPPDRIDRLITETVRAVLGDGQWEEST